MIDFINLIQNLSKIIDFNYLIKHDISNVYNIICIYHHLHRMDIQASFTENKSIKLIIQLKIILIMILWDWPVLADSTGGFSVLDLQLRINKPRFCTNLQLPDLVKNGLAQSMISHQVRCACCCPFDMADHSLHGKNTKVLHKCNACASLVPWNQSESESL